MCILAVLGAGDLGGALAHRAALGGRFDEVRLIDEASAIAAGKALDIQQSGPVERFTTRVIGGDDLSLATDADVMAIADRAGPPAVEHQGEGALLLLDRIKRLNASGVFLCAGAAQAWVVEMAVREAGIPRARIVGSAPLALASALSALVAVETNASALDVHLDVVGVAPHGLLPRWSTATVRGVPLLTELPPPALSRLERCVAASWPPGPFALAVAAAIAAECAVTSSRRTLPLFVSLAGELGLSGCAAIVPCRLDRRGIAETIAPALSESEGARVARAAARG